MEVIYISLAIFVLYLMSVSIVSSLMWYYAELVTNKDFRNFNKFVVVVFLFSILIYLAIPSFVLVVGKFYANPFGIGYL